MHLLMEISTDESNNEPKCFFSMHCNYSSKFCTNKPLYLIIKMTTVKPKHGYIPFFNPLGCRKVIGELASLRRDNRMRGTKLIYSLPQKRAQLDRGDIIICDIICVDFMI